jgi:hypothetical protein
MKKITLLLSLIWLPHTAIAADVYKTVDENGNVTFTDSPDPTKKSEVVDLPPITAIPPTPNKTSPSSSYEPMNGKPEDPYQSLIITHPANDTTIRDNGNFTVQVSIKPRLYSDHKLQLSLDGVTQGKAQRGTSFKLKNIDRGTHQLEVSIVDKKGSAIRKTNSAVHIQRTIFKPPVPTPAPLPAPPAP